MPEAVADAEWNASRNRISNARFVCADTRLGVRPLLEEAGRPDVVVVDPVCLVVLQMADRGGQGLPQPFARCGLAGGPFRNARLRIRCR